MYRLLSHSFLLFLLVCDWAGDPYHGQSAFSREMSSQVACCHSLEPGASRDAGGPDLTSAQQIASVSLSCPAVLRFGWEQSYPPARTDTQRAYLYMSLQQ